MGLLEQIFAAGVVGAGGAGFPTHLKLDCQVEYLLINAAECEPLLNTDKFLIRRFARGILQAVDAVSRHVRARKTYIAVKRVNTAEIESLKAAMADTGSRAAVFGLDNYYPAGDEQMLVYDITGRIVPPGAIPLKVGAVVSNVDTMLNIADAIHGKPVTHKYLTVAGEVGAPSVLRAPLGASFADCLAACGGALINNYMIINGGPMMGKVFPAREGANLVVTKTTSGFIIIPDSGNFVARTRQLETRQILNRAKSACIQCRFCSDLCPRNLTGHRIRPHLVMRKMAALDFDSALRPDDVLREALICSECGVCEAFACPMGLSPRQVNKYVKSVLRGEKFTQQEAPEASPMREYRKISPAKMMSRMGLSALAARKAERYVDLQVNRVSIPCSQHIGAPALPVVEAGGVVTEGQLIARAVEGKPSANLHTGLAGRVVSADGAIVIESSNKE